MNSPRWAPCLDLHFEAKGLRSNGALNLDWLTVIGQQLACHAVGMIGFAPIDIENDHDSKRRQRCRNSGPPQPDRVNLAPVVRLGVIGQKQRNSHAG